MIQANEMRVGNFYQPTDGSSEKYKQVTIDDLIAWSKGARYGKPIPLTESWLLDFGYHLDNNSGAYIGPGEAVYIEWFQSPAYEGVRVEPRYFCAFVHRLQNYSFAGTGRELQLVTSR